MHTEAGPAAARAAAFYGGQIVPKKYVESAGNDTFNAKPGGTGPVRFVSWVKDDKVVLDANPDYWGGRIDVDRWIMWPIPRRRRAWRCSRSEVDIITQLPPDQSDRGEPTPPRASPAPSIAGPASSG